MKKLDLIEDRRLSIKEVAEYPGERREPYNICLS